MEKVGVKMSALTLGSTVSLTCPSNPVSGASSAVERSSVSPRERLTSLIEATEKLPYMLGADWAVIENVPEKFILSAYPLDGMEPYWEGVINDSVSLGVQLASVSPEDYHLPEKGKLILGPGEIALKTKATDENLTTRQYVISRYKDGCSWLFTHFQLNTWGDGKVPSDKVFDHLMSQYEDKVEELIKSPAISGTRLTTQVHCMGGVGRTGTFVFARCLRCQPVREEIGPSIILSRLRSQRSGLVETDGQMYFAIKHGSKDVTKK